MYNVVDSVSNVNFRGNGETAGSLGYLNSYATKQLAENEPQNPAATNGNIAETTGSIAYRIADQPQQDTVSFKGHDENYAQKKKTPWGGIILGTLLTGVLVIGALGYAHKANALEKLNDGFIKNTLTKCNPAMKKCHEWCASTKNLGIRTWETVCGWFHKK